MEDRPGCLNEVTGVFARRGFNVQSLAVGTSEAEGRSRITMVVPGGSDSLQNLIKQVRFLIDGDYIPYTAHPIYSTAAGRPCGCTIKQVRRGQCRRCSAS